MLPGGHQPKVTRLSKAITALLIIVFVVDYFIPSTSGYLALVPGRTLPCVWNLVTAGFVTTDIVTLTINVAALILLARLVEPVYGSKEFLYFLFVVNFSTCICVFLGVYIAFAITQSGRLLYTEFYGFHGIAAGLLVAVKQIMGDQEAKLFGVIKINIKYIPGVVILTVTAVAAALDRYDVLPFLYLGAYSAWLYLRFFQQQQESSNKGDASDAFKFSGFFPPFLAPLIDAVGRVLGFVFRLQHAPPSEAQVQLKSGPSMLGSDAADANRRRERGAKALEERLGLKRKEEAGDVEDGNATAAAPSTASAYFGGTSA